MTDPADILPLVETVSPTDAAGVAQAVRRAAADRTAVYPIGGGTALDCPMPPVRRGLGVVLRGLDRIVDYAAEDLTITVEAGVTVEQLQQRLAQHCQRLPVDAPQPERTTVGALVATDGAGPRQYGHGTIRDYVLGIRAADGRGQEFAAGGRVVKNAAGYNLARLMVGSWGTLGVITEVSLMVRPMPAQSGLLVCRPRDFAQAEQLLAELGASKVLPAAVELLAGARALENALPGAGESESAVPGPAPESGDRANGLCLVVGFEGLETEVEWMLYQLAGQWRGLEVGESQRVRGRDADRLWERLAEFSPQVEIRVLPGQVTAMMEELVRLDPSCTLQARAGNGAILARFSWTDPSELAGAWRGELRPLVGGAGGRLVLRRGPAGMDLKPDELWTTEGVARRMMRALKDQFDPQHILNPGRLGYEID